MTEVCRFKASMRQILGLAYRALRLVTIPQLTMVRRWRTWLILKGSLTCDVLLYRFNYVARSKLKNHVYQRILSGSHVLNTVGLLVRHTPKRIYHDFSK